MLSFKFIHENDIRRIQLDSDINFDDFLATIKELFHLSGKAETQLYYEDKQHDQVIISSDIELRESINHQQSRSTIVIIIKHYLKHVDFDDIIEFLNEFKDILTRCFLFLLFIINYPVNTYLNDQKKKEEEEEDAIVEFKLRKKQKKLTEMGFNAHVARQELIRNNYNITKTIEILLNK